MHYANTSLAINIIANRSITLVKGFMKDIALTRYLFHKYFPKNIKAICNTRATTATAPIPPTELHAVTNRSFLIRDSHSIL